jgi:hypothetical protein
MRPLVREIVRNLIAVAFVVFVGFISIFAHATAGPIENERLAQGWRPKNWSAGRCARVETEYWRLTELAGRDSAQCGRTYDICASCMPAYHSRRKVLAWMKQHPQCFDPNSELVRQIQMMVIMAGAGMPSSCYKLRAK